MTARTLRHPATEELLASAARTAAATSERMGNHESAGALILIDVTADPAAAAITPKIQVELGGAWVDYLSVTTPIAAVGEYLYLIYPGDVSAAGEVTEGFAIPLPRIWRLAVDVADSDSLTYSAHVMYL